MTFPDYFSDHADRYEALRPTYPDALFAYLASLVPAHDLAWDCATGNGQAALGLTPHFDAVVATDASPQQIALAPPHPKVSYLVAPAERTPLKDGSVDLVTVALALHWFDLDRFYAEVRRVVRPGGVIACWTYHLQTVSPDVDAVVRRLYADILGPYWSPEVRHIENGYRSLPFRFEEITPPPFRLVQNWDMNRLNGHVVRFAAIPQRDWASPLDEIRDELAAAWGDPNEEREFSWDLHLRVGIITGTKP
jgi:ubiquinone/menaquinone biosynthesis C-methylase UbiE